MRRFWLYTASLVALVASANLVAPAFAKNGHGGGGNSHNRGNSHSASGNFSQAMSNVRNHSSSGQGGAVNGNFKKAAPQIKNVPLVLGNSNGQSGQSNGQSQSQSHGHAKNLPILVNNQANHHPKLNTTVNPLSVFNSNLPPKPFPSSGTSGGKHPHKPPFQVSTQSMLPLGTLPPICPPSHPKPPHCPPSYPCPPQYPGSTNNSCWNPWFALGGFGPGIGIFNNGACGNGGYGGYGGGYGGGPIVIEQPVVVESPVVVATGGPTEATDAPDAPAAPPAQVPVGMLIQLNGPGFGAAEGRVGLQSGDLQLAVTVTEWSDETLTIGVPPMPLVRPTPAKLFVFRNDGSVAMELPCVLVMPPPPPAPGPQSPPVGPVEPESDPAEADSP